MDQVALVVGEALVDVVHRADGSVTEFAGGSAANVAVALSRLERPIRFATAFADDPYGAMLRAHLDRAGVRLASDPAAISRTSSARATIGQDGSASYVFDIDWQLNPVELETPPLAVHTCSLGAVLRPGCDDVVALLDRHRTTATITYDINARPSITGTGAEVVAQVERVAALADVVRASDEDLEALYPDRSLAESAHALRALGPAAVVVTRGGEGALWVADAGQGEVASATVTVADTIGAGDTFGAALIDGLWSRGLLGAGSRERLRRLPASEWEGVLAYAARAAAVTVSRPGADPPYRHELS